MPRKKGVRRNKKDEDKLATALRKFRRAQMQSEEALAIVNTVSYKAVTEINRDRNRQIALGLAEDSGSDVSMVLPQNDKSCRSRKKKASAVGSKARKRSASKPGSLTIRTATKKSQRSSTLKNIEYNVHKISRDNVLCSQKAEAEKDMKRKKRKYAFKGKLLPGGKTVPISLQATIVNKILQEEQRSQEAGAKAKQDAIKEYGKYHSGVYRQSINNWLKKCRGAPAGSDITYLLRNRGRVPDCDPRVIKLINQELKDRHEANDAVLDSDMHGLIKKHWDFVRIKLRLPPEELTRERLNKFKDILGKYNTTRVTQKTTLRRDEATSSIRNLLSDDCHARYCNTFDPRLCGNCDASTLRIISAEDPDKACLAWFPSDSDKRSVTSVSKVKPVRDMTPEEKKLAQPNILPQRVKMLITGAHNRS